MARGELRCFPGIEADGDDLEILAGFLRHDADRARQAVQRLGAEHGAAVIHERQHHRAPAEEATQGDDLPLIAEAQLRRNLTAEILVESYFAQDQAEP